MLRVAVVAWVVAAICLVACSKDQSTAPPNDDPPPDTALQVITLNNADSVVLYHTLLGHTDSAWNAIFSPSGAVLATSGRDGTVRLWDVASRSITQTITVHYSLVVGLAFSPDGQTLAAGQAFYATVPSQINLYDVSDGSLITTLHGHTNSVWSLLFLGADTLVSCGLDNHVKLWDIPGSTEMTDINDHTSGALCVTTNPDKSLLLSSSIDKSIRWYNTSSLDNYRTTLGHGHNIGFISFSPDGTLLVSACDDHCIRFWNVSTGDLIRTIDAAQDFVNCVFFSPDGSILVSTGHTGSVKLWNVSTGELLTTLTGHTKPAIRGAFSPDGKLIATAGWDGTVRLWGYPKPVE